MTVWGCGANPGIRFPVQASPGRYEMRARAVRAITAARKLLPKPIADLVAEQIAWDLDGASALGHPGRGAALVDAVLSMSDSATEVTAR